MRCAGRLGCGLLMALNVVDLVLGVALLLLGTFTPSAVAGLNSMLANGDDGSGDSRLDEEADRDFIKDRFWALSVPLVSVSALLLLSVAMSCVGVRSQRCSRCVILSALLGICIGVLEVVMALLARYFFDDARKQVSNIVPCTLEETCKMEDARCVTCQRDLLELEKLLDTLNEQVDWAVVMLLVLAATQLVRACSGGLFSRFSAQTDPLDEALIGNSIWSTGRNAEASFSWSTRQQSPFSTESQSVQSSAKGQKRQKYTERQLRNGGSRSDYAAQTIATAAAATATGGKEMRPSFGGRFSDR